MILPGKHLKYDRSLISIGGDIISIMHGKHTVSEIWERTRSNRSPQASPLSYDWFILSLSFLYTIGAIEYEQDLISARGKM